MSSNAVLDAVSATSSHDAWAVGNVFNFFSQGHDLPCILHWNGILWTRVPLLVSPRGAGLRGVTATAPNDAWAVGFTGSATGQPLILHWNGRSWNPVPSPSNHDFVPRCHFAQVMAGNFFTQSGRIYVRGVEEIDARVERDFEVFARPFFVDVPAFRAQRPVRQIVAARLDRAIGECAPLVERNRCERRQDR